MSSRFIRSRRVSTMPIPRPSGTEEHAMANGQARQHLTLPLLPDERWWGGAVADGQLMPFGARPHRRDLARSAGITGDPRAGNNQSAPLLLSNRGRFVWSERPFAFD